MKLSVLFYFPVAMYLPQIGKLFNKLAPAGPKGALHLSRANLILEFIVACKYAEKPVIIPVIGNDNTINGTRITQFDIHLV